MGNQLPVMNAKCVEQEERVNIVSDAGRKPELFEENLPGRMYGSQTQQHQYGP